jgi:hypothetical protein
MAKPTPKTAAKAAAKALPVNTMAHTRIARRTAGQAAQPPAPRVIHYIDPAPRRDLVAYTAAELAARRREQEVLYARWVARQAAIAERDRKVRRFWLGFGAIAAAGLLTGLVVAGWLVWHAIATVGLGALAVPIVILAVVGLLVVGGHRCITVVQHWH